MKQLQQVNSLRSGDVRVWGGLKQARSPMTVKPRLSAEEDDFPFRVTVEDAGATLRVGQGYIWIGSIQPVRIGGSGFPSNGAEYDWPGVDDTDTVALGALADDVYLLYMKTPISPDNGYFTASYRPSLGVCPALTDDRPLVEDFRDRAKDHVISRFTVASGKISGKPRQDLRQNIRGTCTAEHWYDGYDDFFYTRYALSLMAAPYWVREVLTHLESGVPVPSDVVDEDGDIVHQFAQEELARPAEETEVNGGSGS
jgi:hypothetical protein